MRKYIYTELFLFAQHLKSIRGKPSNTINNNNNITILT